MNGRVKGHIRKVLTTLQHEFPHVYSVVESPNVDRTIIVVL